MKLREALEAFLRVDRAEQTRRTYETFLTRFVDAIGPERPLDLIRPQDIDVFVREMKQRKVKYAEHSRRPTVNAPLSSTTIYKNVKMIKTFFKWCVDNHLLEESPAGYLVNRRPVRPLGQGKAATEKEVMALLEAARFKPRDFAILQLLVTSGCRAGEAAGLKIRDLDLVGCHALVDGKGDVRRRIYFTEDAAIALAAWLEVRPDTDHDYVFTSIRKEHPALTAWAISSILRRLARVAGLKRELGAHSLRHRVGLIFARKRISPRLTQHYLGHTNIKTTLEYYQDIDDDDIKLAGKLLEPRPEEDWREETKQNPAAKLLKPRTGSG